jgi:hypothetical protein
VTYSHQERVSFKFTGLCVLLKRLAYPNRLFDLKKTFGRGVSELSMIANTTLEFIFENFVGLLTSFDQWWLAPSYLKTYANAIQALGCPLNNCCGFIDGKRKRNCIDGQAT